MGNSPRRIFTHVRPDLDALASVWFTVRFILACKLDEVDIHFVPAFWDGSAQEGRFPCPALRREDHALDIDVQGRGNKGFKGKDGTVYSCFASLQTINAGGASANGWDREHMLAIREFSRFVDIQDSKGHAIQHIVEDATEVAGMTFHEMEGYSPEVWIDEDKLLPIKATGLTSVIHALSSSLKTDAALLEAVMPIFDGFLANGLSRLRAEKEAAEAEIISVTSEAEQAEVKGKVAIVRDSKEFATNGILFSDYGVKAVVFVDGNNMGITRARDVKVPCSNEHTRAVIEASGEGWQDDGGQWFAHSAGFLLARGTHKAPMESPSSIAPRELAEAMSKALE